MSDCDILGNCPFCGSRTWCEKSSHERLRLARLTEIHHAWNRLVANAAKENYRSIRVVNEDAWQECIKVFKEAYNEPRPPQ